MTQEELDALMSADLEGEMDSAKEASKPAEESEKFDENNFRVRQEVAWPPPPPSEEHKVVRQLDDVAREGEEKSSQMFDILEKLSADASGAEESLNKAIDGAAEVKETFERLHEHFPQIKTFEARLETIAIVQNLLEQVKATAQSVGDQTMAAMDMMQYQDIHRQKIERVINVMRALSRYMNSLFDSKVADEKRVSSAVHIVGDATDDVVDEEDIEALIAAFGGGKK